MAQQYYGLITNIGRAKLVSAAAGGAPMTLSTMAFGDGAGAETAPTKTATALVNERYRAPVIEKYPHPTNASILYVEGTIPSGIGGWTLREAGIYDAAGDLIVIAKPPSMDVALISEGASTEGIVRLPLVFESLDAVQLLIDPTVVLATQGWVLDRLLARPFITVDSITTTAPPAAPASHSLYVVPAGATGAFAGQTHKLAYYQGGWIFRDSPLGKRIACSDTGEVYRRVIGGWERLWVEPEVDTFLVKSGQAAPHSADGRLLRAIRSQRLNYAIAGGTANDLTISLDPAPPSLAAMEGMPIRFRASATNTGAMTLKVGVLPERPLLRANGSILFDADIITGGIYEVVFDGTNYRAVTLTSPPTLIRPLTLYVNRAIGNDSNDGTANTPDKALWSIQGLIDRAYGYGPGSFTILGIVAAGIYGPVSIPQRPGPALKLVGDISNPANVSITGAGGDAFAARGGAIVEVSGMKASAPGAGNAGWIAYDQSRLSLTGLNDSGACGGAATHAFGGGSVVVGAHRFSGNCSALYLANVLGRLSINSNQAITSVITVSNATASAAGQGSIAVSLSLPVTFSGAGNVIGARYAVATNAVIDAGGGGVNFFPGNSAGTAGSGGQYV